MNVGESREWTLGLRQRFLPQEQDGHAEFLAHIKANCMPGATVLDLGCGEENLLGFLQGQAAEIIGVDSRPLEGPYDRYVQADLNEELPLPEASVDLAANKFLLEHLARPQVFFDEIGRVLRPGGKLVLIAPNTNYYPYAANCFLSKIISQEKRIRLVSAFQDRCVEGIFEVHYACNTPAKLRWALENAGFRINSLETFCDCLVSAVIRPLGALAVGYEYIVSLLGIKNAKGLMVTEAQKPL